MYIEYACTDYSLNEIDVKANVEHAIKHNIKNICVLPYSINTIRNIDNNIKIICILDYPFGLSDLKSRSSIVLNAVKSNISTLDIVAPNKILANRKYDKFRDDIKANLDLCSENNVELRYILEYRVFSHEVLAKVCQILKSFNINTIIPSSGVFLDDINDNLIACNFLNMKSGINVISSGNIYLEKHAKLIALNANIFGTRLYHKNSIDLLSKYFSN